MTQSQKSRLLKAALYLEFVLRESKGELPASSRAELEKAYELIRLRAPCAEVAARLEKVYDEAFGTAT